MTKFRNKYPLLAVVLVIAVVYGFFFTVSTVVSGNKDIKDLTYLTEAPLELPENPTSVWTTYANSSIEAKFDVKGDMYYEMVVFGQVMEGSLVKATRTLDILNQKGDTTPLVIRINTPGGSAAELLEFTAAAQSYNGVVVVVNEGIALSAGAIIYSLGDVRVSGVGNSVLFHSVQGGYMGKINLEILEGLVEHVKYFNQIVYNMMVIETGQSEETIRETIFIENKEGHYLYFSDLVKFNMVDLTVKNFNSILNTVGIQEVTKYDNKQDDVSPAKVLVDSLLEKVLKVFS